MRRQFTATVVGVSPATTSDFNGGAHTVTVALDGQGPCAPISKSVELPLFSAEEARALGALYRIHHAVRVTFETPGVPDVSEEKADNRRRPQEDDRTEPARPCPTTGFNGEEDEKGGDDPTWDLSAKRGETRTEALAKVAADAWAKAPNDYDAAWLAVARAVVRAIGRMVPGPSAAAPAPLGAASSAPDGYRESLVCPCPATSEYDPPCPRHGIVGIGVTPRDELAPAPAPPMVDGRPSCCDRASGASGGIWALFRPSDAQGWCIDCRSSVTVHFCPFCGATLPEVA